MPFDEAHVRAIAERIASSLGLEVVDLEYHGGGKGRVLRIFIEKNAQQRRALEQQAAGEAEDRTPSPPNWDRLAGVTHEDCADYSRELGTVLDVEDAVPGGEYMLEVSSPGLDRKLVKLADFQRFSGSRVKIMTREPVAGNRHFEGRFRTLDDGRIALNPESGKKKGKHNKKKSAAEEIGRASCRERGDGGGVGVV